MRCNCWTVARLILLRIPVWGQILAGGDRGSQVGGKHYGTGIPGRQTRKSLR